MTESENDSNNISAAGYGAESIQILEGLEAVRKRPSIHLRKRSLLCNAISRLELRKSAQESNRLCG